MDNHICTRCFKELKSGDEVFLELDQRTGKFVDPKKIKVPMEFSQGGFPFGRSCAKIELKG